MLLRFLVIPECNTQCVLLSHLDLFVPRVRTALAQCFAFAVTGPSSWNGLPHLLRAKLISGISATTCCSLKTFLFPLELPHWKHLWL